MHPIALLLLCALCVIVVFGRGAYAAAALIAGTCLMTMGQAIVVGPFTFHFVRLVILVGFLRTIVKGELFRLRLTGMDSAVLGWLFILMITSVGHASPREHFVGTLGTGFNTALAYFVFRALVGSVDDIVEVGKWLIAILLVLAVAMLVEQSSGHSMFEVFGGVLTEVRNDRIRAMGPFRHPILAGSVGATLIPLVFALRYRWRAWSTVGIVGCLVISLASASSGPLLALGAGIFALSLWKYRDNLRSIIWMGVAALLLLDLVMKDPVWYLMARIDLVGGSTGWHRAYLIDMAIAHFGEWWLAGTDYTRHWMPTGVSYSPDHSDMTNHYIWLGVGGGIGLVAGYVWTLVMAFKAVGRVLKRDHGAPAGDRFVVWALGSVLFSHVVNSLSIAYFDQSVVLIYFVLACIGSLDANPPSVLENPDQSSTTTARRVVRPWTRSRRLQDSAA